VEEDDLFKGLIDDPVADEGLTEDSLFEGLVDGAVMAPAQPEVADEQDEGVVQEAIEGAISGLIAIPQGILELGAIGVDLAAGTSLSSAVTEKAEGLREYLGLDPTGLVGKGTEAIFQYAIPGLGAAGVVSKLSKVGRLSKALGKGKASPLKNKDGTLGLTRGEKLGLGAQQVAAAGLADAVVATDGTTTIADFFEGGPTQTDQEIGLAGREEALRRLTNKLSVGAEGAAATIVAPAILAGTANVAGRALTQDTIAGVTNPLAKGVQLAAKTTIKGGQKVKKVFDDAEADRIFRPEQQGALGQGLAGLSSIFRYRSFLPERIAEQRSLISGDVEAQIKGAKSVLAGLDKEIDVVLKEAAKVTSKKDSPLIRQKIFTNLEEFMTGPTKEARLRAFDELPENVQLKATEMRKLVDRLSNDVLNSNYVKSLDGVPGKKGSGITDMGAALRSEIEENLNKYLRRRYRIFEDAKYVPTEESIEAGIKGFMGSKRQTIKELSRLVNNKAVPAENRAGLMEKYGLIGDLDDPTSFRLVGDEVTPEQAKQAVDAFIKRHRPRTSKGQTTFTSRVEEFGIQPGMFKKRMQRSDFKRALLGEVSDTREAFLGTVSDLAEFRAVDDYFGSIANASRSSETMSKFFVSPEKLRLMNPDELENYVVLGKGDDVGDSAWGSLQGFAVPNALYNDMTRLVINDMGTSGNLARKAYSGFLRLKSGAQYAKTVLSFTTQIRNVTSAGLMALAQGNVGKGANLGESVRLVMDDIFDMKPEDALRELQEVQALGVTGTQAELRELQDLIKQGLGFTEDATVDGVKVGRKFGSSLTDSTLGSFISKTGKVAQNLYQGGDDVWKIYNYKFEQNKLRNALRSETLENQYKALNGAPVQQGTEITSDMVNRAYKEEAARIVRNTVPNYNLAPEAIRGLRKLPVGNFITFPYEILRTGVNTISRAVDELASDSAAIRQIGLRRITGAMSTYAIAPMTLKNYAHEVSGISEDELDAYQRSIAMPWERNARLIPTGRDENGLPTYINYSYTNPYDLLEKISIAAFNKAEEGRLQGKPSAQIVFEAAQAPFAELFAPFTEESIITGKIRDVLDPEAETLGVRQLAQLAGGRAGNTITGARVYNPEDSAGDKLAKSFAHVIDGVMPGSSPIDVRSGEVELSRFARAFLNDTGLSEEFNISSKDRAGLELDLSEELARVISGVGERKIDAPVGLRFKGFEFGRARQNAKNIVNTVANRKNVVSSDLVDAYRASEEATFRVQNQMFSLIEDMKKIGMSRGQIKKTLKNANVSGINEILRGRYVPPKITSVITGNMRRNETIDQYRKARPEIEKIRREARSRKFGVAEEETPVSVSAPVDQTEDALFEGLLDNVAPVSQAPVSTTSNLGTSSPAQAGTRTNPAFLSSGNPVDTLKNLAIAQRNP
jgi:hypothetical protein